MALQRSYLFLILKAPKLDSVVVTAWGQILSIRRELNCLNWFSVALKCSYEKMLKPCAPYFDGRIPAARSQTPSVRREGNTGDLFFVAMQSICVSIILPPSLKLDSLVIASISQILAVRWEGGTKSLSINIRIHHIICLHLRLYVL
jgi:hypothetical protein